MSHIDLEIYNSLGEVMEDELPSLVMDFISDADGKIKLLKQHVKHDDAENIFSVSHSLKSSSANLGAVKMSKICETIEADSRKGSTERAPELIENLTEAFHHSSEELKQLIG
ncbi:MAG: Hpt domain-containing protein [Gammaproteobacteria bacterium]|nr:Hpt domain-containing protein [Gammaproteobacteria bacterium]MDH5594364.1 Hpt domain-containing protein [Gammaproteobacteria bacterium]MDH5613608.1 Hpt domain-containing protein [Gammaproteobacteria bacterium]